jgi:putative glutamine amidotransferase
MTGRPTIGLTLDSEGPGGYSKRPWYALRENYGASVVRAGDLPVQLRHEPDHAEAIFEATIDACAGVRRGHLEARG